MKKGNKLLLLSAAFAAILCMSAFAANTADVCLVESVEGVSIVPDGTEKAATVQEGETTFYVGTKKLNVSYADAHEGAFYLLAVLNRETALPTAADIVYIDQATATADGVSFAAFPAALTEGEYFVYLSASTPSGLGSGGLAKIGSFSCRPAYTLGDVNGDREINSTDALLTLQGAVKKTILTDLQKLAANVNRDAEINSTDALMILQYAVKKISGF